MCVSSGNATYAFETSLGWESFHTGADAAVAPPETC